MNALRITHQLNANRIATFVRADTFLLQSNLSNLRDVLFVGNPMYDEVSSRKDARIEILKYLPNVTKIDGEMVKPSERDVAKRKLRGE